MTPSEIKQQFRRNGETVTQWAQRHGYRRHAVYLVLNGQSKALYGQGHEIAVKLGLKPNPSTLQLAA